MEVGTCWVSEKAFCKVLALPRRMHSIYQFCSAGGQALCQALTEETEVSETWIPHFPSSKEKTQWDLLGQTGS